MRRLIDEALPRHRTALALFLVLGICACLLGRPLFALLSAKFDFVVEQELGQNLRIAIFEQLSRLSADYHESTPAGDQMIRLQTDVDQVSQLGSQTVSSLVRAVMFFVINAIIMLRIDARMTIAMMPAIVFFLCIKPRFVRLMRDRADAAQSEAGRAGGVLTEYLSALPQLQLLGAESLILKNALSVWGGVLRARKGQRDIELLYSAAINGAIVLSTLLVLIVGGAQVLRGALSIGGLVAFYAYSTRILDPVSSLLDVFSRSQRVGASIRRVQAILFADETVPDVGSIMKAPTKITQGITIQSVTFAYSSQHVALKDVSFRIAAGERVGIVGPSGSGKSSLVRLLVRLADPQVGDITLDGHPLSDYKLAALRSTICYVPQNPVLFQGTVADNLRYAKPDATDDDLTRVIATVHLTDLIARLPGGLDTALGPFGRRLSGGEQQRLALARALLRSAPVLILDESTSALDIATEEVVLKGIAEFHPWSVLIIISHRLASLTWLDHLLVLKAGEIVGFGNHQDLHAISTFYRSLYESRRTAAVVH